MKKYNKINWKDAPDYSTPVNAKNLNHMEEGIAEAANSLESITGSDVAYDNSETGLNAANMQQAIDAIFMMIGGMTFVVLTQDEYDDMESHDPKTLYFCMEE